MDGPSEGYGVVDLSLVIGSPEFEDIRIHACAEINLSAESWESV